MKYFFYTLFVYALLVSLAYLASVAIGIHNGQSSIYNSITIVLFIFSCLVVCLSAFSRMKIKIVSAIIFFINYIAVGYNDLAANFIFYSNNDGRALFNNAALFFFGYILPTVGIAVGARLLMLSQDGKAVHTSGRTGAHANPLLDAETGAEGED